MFKDELQKKIIIDTLIVDSVLLALSCIFCFFGLYNIPLGFLLGVVVSIINHLLLCLQTEAMINSALGSSAVGITVGAYMLRFLLWGGALFLALFLEHIGYKIFAWYSVVIGFLMIKFIIMIKYSKYTKKDNIIIK